MKTMKKLAFGLALAALPVAAGAQTLGQVSGNVVKLGILNDQSGVYADYGGKWSVEAARIAVEEFGGNVLGAPDRDRHGRSPEQAGHRLQHRTRQWFDQDGVNAIMELTTSSVALAVQNALGREEEDHDDERGRDVGPDRQGLHALRLPLGLRHARARGRDRRLARGDGRRHVVLPHGRLRLRLRARTGHGPKYVASRRAARCVGQVRHPLAASDFSSFLLQAQGSKAKIIGLANAGADTNNSIKQAAEFGIVARGANGSPPSCSRCPRSTASASRPHRAWS